MAIITNILLLLPCLLALSSLFTAAATINTVPPQPRRATTTVRQFLNFHNVVRAKHNIPPLKWNVKLANFAKWYANTRRRDCALVHSARDLGENIFRGGGRRWKAADAVNAWADQEKYYFYGSNGCMADKDCLHYTQLVWKSTKYVGCAMTKCKSGDTYVVCEYYPHGNVIGERPY